MISPAVKYPRTAHLPFSPGATSDDEFITPTGLTALQSLGDFIVTEKMDGGNVTMMRDYFYARSLDSGTQPWDTAAKALWARVRFQIPEGWRVSGESLYARRSVSYDSLAGLYLIFGVWDEDNNLLDWDTTTELATELGIPIVPVLYRGDDWKTAISVWSRTKNANESEGFVIRHGGSIPAKDFRNGLAKWVRADHIQTSDDWRSRDDFAVNGVVKAE